MPGTLSVSSSTTVNYGQQVIISWTFAGWNAVDCLMISPGNIILQSPPASGSYNYTPLCTGWVSVYIGIDTGGQWQMGHGTTGAGIAASGLQAIPGDTYASVYITVNNSPYVAGSWVPGIYYPQLNTAYSAGSPQLWSPSCFNPYTGSYSVSNATVSRTSAPNYGNSQTNMACEAAIVGEAYATGYGINALASVYGNTPGNYSSGNVYYPNFSGSADPVFYGGSNPLQGILDINWWMAGLCANPGNVETGPYYQNTRYQQMTSQNLSNYFVAIPSSNSVKYQFIAPCQLTVTGSAYFSGTDSADGGGAGGYLWLGIHTMKGVGSSGSGPYGPYQNPATGPGELNVWENGGTGSAYMSQSLFNSVFSGFDSASFDVNDTIEFWCGVSNGGGEFCFKNCTGGWLVIANPA